MTWHGRQAPGVPEPPQLATITATSVLAIWLPPNMSGTGQILGYNLQMALSPDNSSTFADVFAGDALRCPVSGLFGQQEYCFRVRCVGACGCMVLCCLHAQSPFFVS
jgi:hypothetical protein